MIFGISLVLSACFVWGLIFVIPQLLTGFTPIEVALGRYFFFGSVSCLFMCLGGLKKWRRIPFYIWSTAFSFALVVNVFYYVNLILGLRYSSASVIALILGISPISIPFYGNWRKKIFDFKPLIIPSLFIATGLILVNFQNLQGDLAKTSVTQYIFGLCCGFFSLCAWNWYAVANDEFLHKHPNLSPRDWSTLIGTCTLLWVILIGGLLWGFSQIETIQKYYTLTDELKWFIFGSLILGLICSWLGAYLWNSASKHLPISLAGQLSIFETVFGLLFVYIIEHRCPPFLELMGIIIILSGVLISMYSFKKAPLAMNISPQEAVLKTQNFG